MKMGELAAWFAFVEVLENFLGNYKTENYKKTVRNMLEEFKHYRVNMNMEIHFLHSLLDRVPENLENVNNSKIPGKMGHANDGRLLLVFETFWLWRKTA